MRYMRDQENVWKSKLNSRKISNCIKYGLLKAVTERVEGLDSLSNPPSYLLMFQSLVIGDIMG